MRLKYFTSEGACAVNHPTLRVVTDTNVVLAASRLRLMFGLFQECSGFREQKM